MHYLKLLNDLVSISAVLFFTIKDYKRYHKRLRVILNHLMTLNFLMVKFSLFISAVFFNIKGIIKDYTLF